MTDLTVRDRYLLIILAIFLSVPPIFSIFLTCIDIYYTVIALPCIALLASIGFSKPVKTSLFSILKESLINKFTFYILLIFFTPLIWGGFQGDYFYSEHKNAHWINASTVFIVPLFYFASQLFLSFLELLGIKRVWQLSIFAVLFSLSFSIDWFYSLYKSLIFADYRWNGSAGNANIWACESTIVLLIIIAAFIEYKKEESLKLSPYAIILAVTVVFLCLIGIVKAFSLATLLGILACLFCIGAYKLLRERVWVIIGLVLLLLGIGLIFYILFGDLSFKAKQLFLGKKFFPRIKLWRNIDDLVLDFKFLEIFLGIGFERYASWLASLKKLEYNHIHNVFYHYFIQYGLMGFLGSTMLYLKLFFANSFYLKILAVFLIAISFFDVSVFFEEVQILLFLLLPVLERFESEKTD
ncbi:MAG: hypothetical protein ACKO3R_05490 [bacterium]